MRFELTILTQEDPMDESVDIRRCPGGSIDFNFYRRRAVRQRRLAQRLWLQRAMSTVTVPLAGFAAGIARALGDRAKPVQRCCSARERLACCA